MAERIIRQGQIFKHFKNKIYQIVAVAKHSETMEKMVVYQALYGDYGVYVRPFNMFVSEVDREKYPEVKQQYRFELIGEMGDGQDYSIYLKGNFDFSTRENVGNTKEKESKLQKNYNLNEAVDDDESVMKFSNVVTVSEDDYDDEGEVSPILLDFLNLDTYEEKLELFTNLRDKIDSEIMTSIAVALDIGLKDGMSESEQYESIKSCLQTFVRFEDNRKR